MLLARVDLATASDGFLRFNTKKIVQQDRFVHSNAKFIGYFGGYNNGKTWGLCLRAAMHSLRYPGNRGLICRALVKDLNDSTRHEFFRIFGCNESNIEQHPLVERFNSSRNFLRFKNGSEVYFRHLQDERAIAGLKSLTINWFGIDQAEDVPESAWLYLLARIGREKYDPLTGKLLPPKWGAVVGNPAGHNWVWQYWVANGLVRDNGLVNVSRGKRKYGVEQTGKYFYEMHNASTEDNPYRSDDYVSDLKNNYSEMWYRRFVEGSWDAFAGQVYEEFDRKAHVINPIDIPDAWKAGIGADFGFNHPTAFLWVAVDYSGNWYVYDELVAREQLPNYYCSELKRKGLYANRRQIPIFAPHDARNRNPITGINHYQAYHDNGVYLNVGNQSSPLVGIERIKQYMKYDDEKIHPVTGRKGSPSIFIFSTCEHLIEELGLYRWKELKPGQEVDKAQPDEVVKVHDDALDALRMFAMGWSSRFVPDKPVEKTIDEQELEHFLAINDGIEGDIIMRYRRAA